MHLKKKIKMYHPHKVIIVGAGGIGRAVGLILADMPEIDADIFIGDLEHRIASDVVDWIKEGSSSLAQIEPFVVHPTETTDQMDYVFKSGEIILDCLPGGEAPRMAAIALKYGLHYVNLTEYVKESDQILQMSQGAQTGFVLQAGLAPGYINILTHHLYKEFISKYGDQEVDHVSMKVGALTRMTTGPHYYGFTWSPIGVATEYVKDAIVLRNGNSQMMPALSETTQLIIDGIHYEDDFTSGGAADMPEFFKNKVKSLDYKTIRYPGHYQWVREQLKEMGNVPDKDQVLLKRMLNDIPLVDDDLIILYASVKGKDKQGNLRIIEKSKRIEPMMIGSHKLKAIQLTTAAPMLECARMLLTGHYKGPILQSQINTEEFLKGPFVQLAYGSNRSKEKMKLEQ